MIQVSLVIPNRNNVRFLPQCLASALAQTRPYREIVVVDDASTDDSVALLRAHAAAHPQLRLIELPSRRGVSAARNTGVRAATSPYVALLDADDFLWDSAKNENEAALIERHLPREDVVAFSDVRLVTEDGGDLGCVSTRRRVREGELFRHLLCLEVLVPRDFTFGRRLHEQAGGFDEGLHLYEDWDFKLRLAHLAEFRYTGAMGVAYRCNSAGLSRAPLRAHYRTMHVIAWKNTRHLPWIRRWPVRLLAQWGIFRFLRGATWTWLKKSTIQSGRT
jgi:glycosyltransferase involved in cell wall biosynthesis